MSSCIPTAHRRRRAAHRRRWRAMDPPSPSGAGTRSSARRSGRTSIWWSAARWRSSPRIPGRSGGRSPAIRSCAGSGRTKARCISRWRPSSTRSGTCTPRRRANRCGVWSPISRPSSSSAAWISVISPTRSRPTRRWRCCGRWNPRRPDASRGSRPRDIPPTRRAPAGSATRMTRSAGSAARPSPRAGRTSR